MSMSDNDFHSVETLEGVSNDTDLDQFSADFFGEKKAEEAPAKADADEDKIEDAKKDDTHVEEDALAEEKEEEEEQEKPEPKPKTRSEKRIEELNAKFRQEQREKEDLKRRLEQLEAAQQTKEPKTTPAAVKEDGPSPEDVNEDGTEKYPLGEFDPRYIRDLTRFTISQERVEALKAEKAEAQKTKVEEAQTALAAEWNTKLPTAIEKYEDFIDKTQDFVDTFDDLDEGYSNYLADTIMGMEFGTDVLYYLANNPEEAKKIVESGVRKATIALGRIESRFEVSKQEPEPRRVSNAPPPPPVNKGSAAARVTVADDTDDLVAFEKKFFKR